MVRKATRNRAAEEYNNDLIPKDTKVICGITELEASVETQQRGKFKGRNYDKVRTSFEVLVGDFAGANFTANINNNTDRQGMAATPYDPWPYGNSKKYCELCAALIEGCTLDDVLIPEEENLEWYEQQFVGKVVAITVGTYTFKVDDDENPGQKREITIQTVKSVEPITADIRTEFAEAITTFEATMAMQEAPAGQGTLGDLGDEPQDDEPPF